MGCHRAEIICFSSLSLSFFFFFSFLFFVVICGVSLPARYLISKQVTILVSDKHAPLSMLLLKQA
ncbi:hypothetical protein LY78DRAFT_19269 [Colletotrichum sublineola]|nr:hypothetical protein LY78DRAFT_19269 [Colletotrichum sublineola]